MSDSTTGRPTLCSGVTIKERNVSDGALLHTLFTACIAGRDDYVQQLLVARADVDQGGDNGATPMWAACLNGHSNCVQLLLTARAAIDQADHYGDTPLIITCVKGHSECVQLLLTAHAAIDQADNNGNTHT